MTNAAITTKPLAVFTFLLVVAGSAQARTITVGNDRRLTILRRKRKEGRDGMKANRHHALRVLAALVAVFLIVGSSAKADLAFGTPTKLGPPVNSSYVETLDCISADGLELYLDSKRPGGAGDFDLWVAKRNTTDADWGEPVNLGPAVNSAGADTYACISHNGLELYFNSEDRPGGYGGWDIWVTRRTTKDTGWGPPAPLSTWDL